MGTYKRTEGQTLIETAIILFLLMLILLGITEFSRAWYTKNSLKNAVRQGARVAVVTTDKSKITAANGFICNAINIKSCPYAGNEIINAVCCQPGVPRAGTGTGTGTTSLTVTCSGSTTKCNDIQPNDTVKVQAGTKFQSVVGSSFWPWLQNINISTDASMRYE